MPVDPLYLAGAAIVLLALLAAAGLAGTFAARALVASSAREPTKPKQDRRD